MLLKEQLHTVAGLQLLIQQMVTGINAGIHLTQQWDRGITFEQFRQYQAGDDIRLIDWKAYARSDRYYIRESAKENSMIVHLLLDNSASMAHPNREETYEKMDIARLIVGSLAQLIFNQGDRICLHLLSDETQNHGVYYDALPPLLNDLLRLSPKGNAAVKSFTEASKLFLVISDCYETEQEISKTLQQLVFRKNEVLLFYLTFENEQQLDYPTQVLLEDLETGQTKLIHTNNIKADYLQNREDHQTHFSKMMKPPFSFFCKISNEMTIGKQLNSFLLKRQNAFRR